jgi:DNA-binding response OmpR family regulator
MSRILIIDDDKTVCNGMKSILERERYEVDIALTGRSGIRKVKHNGYELIYLDIHMPGFNAVETFRQIKNMEENVKICIITAMPDDRLDEYFLLVKEGAVERILRKPVFKDVLLKTTRELLELKTDEVKILVIDDDKLLRESFKHILEKSGYNADFAETGSQALTLFKSRQYHLIFMDVLLPDKGGKRLLSEIRAVDTNVKICIMSAYMSKIAELSELDDRDLVNTIFCMKPIVKEDIIKIIKNVKYIK